MQIKVGQTLISCVQGDITGQKVDAIVNAANSSLMGGGGVDGAIHRAGGPAIVAECREYVDEHGQLPAGRAMMTGGGNLPARHVIHTVGPIWHGGTAGEEAALRSAYSNCLDIAVAYGLTSIAFPSISTGAYRYPVEKAARVAVTTVTGYARENDGLEEVRFVLFSADNLEVYASELEGS